MHRSSHTTRFHSRIGTNTAARQPGQWRWAAGSAVLLTVLAAAAACRPGLADATPAAPIVPYPHTLAEVNFAVAGDVIPHEAVRAAAEAAGPGANGWAALFSEVGDMFRKADFGFVNMETPIAPQHSHGTKPFLFDAPIALITGLQQSGIKIVSFANNHVMDQNWAGFTETREHLREQGMAFAGSGDTAASAWQPTVVEKNGIKVGWLGMTRWLNGSRNPLDETQPHVNFFPYPDDPAAGSGKDAAGVLEAVRQARAQCDLLVVSIHWGVEYAPAPKPEDVDIAHKMLDAGATVIVGHHPHVLQPVETYRTQDGRNALIFFSLGNFLSNQSRDYRDGLMPDKDGDPRDSLIGLFSAVRQDYGPGGVRVELGNVDILPVWGENNRNDIEAGRAHTPVIRPILIDREIPRLQARLDALDSLAGSASNSSTPSAAHSLTAAQKAEFIETTSRLKLLTDRRALLLARTGDKFLIDPPKLATKP